MHDRRGFVTTRLLVALLITISLLPLSVNALYLISSLDFSYSEIADEIAMLELRRLLLIAYDVENYGNELSFIYHNDNYSLRLINNRLILQPGYQVFLSDIDDAYFQEEGNSIYVYYIKNNKEFKTPIIKQNGIYIDDFSFDDDVDSDDNFSDD